MPELPDITVYAESLAAKVVGSPLKRVRLLNPFLLRTAVPPIASVEGLAVTGIERLGKRIVIAVEGDLFLVIHLMIAGRLRWLAMFVFTLASSLSFIDRQILAALAPAIQSEFGLTLAQYGAVVSVFSIVYALTAPLAGVAQLPRGQVKDPKAADFAVEPGVVL